MNKKIMSFLLIFVMSFSFIPTVYAASKFSDVKEGHWAYNAITELSDKGIISGMGDGTYGIDNKVTREQFMTLLVGIFETPSASDSMFKDVPADSWSNSFISAGLKRGIVDSKELSDNNFKPKDPMSREIVALWITRSLNITGDAPLNFKDSDSIINKNAVANAAQSGLLSGYEDGTYRPTNTLTRAEAAIIIKNVMDKSGQSGQTVPNEKATPNEQDQPYDPSDYDPANLRDSKNTVTLQDNVSKIEPKPGTNVLTIEDDEKGYYVFENITDEIANLKIGNIFAIYPCESVPRGISLKVKEIKITDNKAEIWEDDLEFGEVFEEMDIAQIIPIPLEDIDISDLSEGVTISEYNPSSTIGVSSENSDKDHATFLNADNSMSDMSSQAWSFGANPTQAFMLERNNFFLTEGAMIQNPYKNIERLASISMSSGLSFNIDYKLSPNQKISGKIELKRPEIKLDVETSFLSLDKLEVSVGTSVNAKVEYKASIKDTKKIGDSFSNATDVTGEWGLERTSEYHEMQLSLAKLSFPIGTTPFFAEYDLYLSLNAEGAIIVTVEAVVSSSNGCIYYKDGENEKIEKTSKTLTAKAEAEGKLFVGPQVGLGISCLKVVRIGLDVKVGPEATAKIKTYKGELNLKDGSASLSTPLIGVDSNGLSYYHLDFLCVKGEINFILKADAKLTIGVGKAKFEPQITIVNLKLTITDFYISAQLPGTTPIFGLGECPNKYSVPKISRQPQDVKAEEGKSASFKVESSSAPTGQVYKYQWKKNGVAIQGATNPTLNIPAVKQEDVGSYTCQVYNDVFSLKDEQKKLLSVESKTAQLTIGNAGEGEGAEVDPNLPDFESKILTGDAA